MSAFGGVPVFGGDGWSSTGSGRRRELPGALSVALVLVHTLFAFTVLGGIGLLLTAASLDAVDGRLLAQMAFAAAPGTIGWVLARRSWSGGVWVWRGLLALQAWLIVAALGNAVDGSGRGFTQLFLPILIVVFLVRRESREWFRLPDAERAERRPFSMARMIRWRRDEGQTAVEYAGLVAVVAAIIAALVVSGLGTQIFTGLQSAVCKVTGTACPAAGSGGEEVQAGDGADGADGTDGGGPDGSGPAGQHQEGRGQEGHGQGGPGDGDQGDGGQGDEDGGAGDGGTGSGGTGGTGPGGADSGGQDSGGSGSGGRTGGSSGGDGSASQGGDGGSGGVTSGVSGEDTGASYTEETDEEKDDAAEDEPGWEEDEQAAEDGGDEGGDEGCTSGFGAFFGCVGDQFKQVGQGLFVDGIWGDVTGIWDTVTDPGKAWEGLKDYGSSLGDQWSEDAKDASEKWGNGDYFDALTDWGGASWNTGVTVLDDMFVGDEVRDQWNNGEKTRAATNVVWNVGSLFIPGYGEAKVVQKLGKLGKLGKLTENAAEAAADAKKAARAGDVDAAEKAAKEADEAADAAEERARQSGCTLTSAPGRRVPYGGDAPGFTGSAGSGTTVLAAGGSRSPYVVLAEGGCDEEAKKQAEEARKQAEEAEKAEKEAKKEESRKKVAKWKKPSWYNDLKNPRKGSKDGGDGHWKAKKAVAYWPKSEVWMRYQEQVSKVKRGKEYAVKDPKTGRDVDFDGWDSSRQTYVEAKFGYSNKVRADGTLEPAQADKFIEQARRQLSAANGKPVEWNFSNKAVAEAAEEAFDDAGIGVVVKYTPWEK
ncbi:Tox-REase-5 domain-containing protein [Streptomyces sp. WAC04114]|uniref:Tox-REase-5 domain-containing protein n=1 Tax=Streptomyces sp. WAC04114 TaxID=2867961 RepID=UPI001C8C7631|nr:Tox-REase-5 domain-containing protein [Streptomyces sp. WAC04114]MBX9366855.1 restriction endonuclease fold toxin 5 domain-containing protein [Streptomyces sp. WAC04114]